jgi:hypothetical protein
MERVIGVVGRFPVPAERQACAEHMVEHHQVGVTEASAVGARLRTIRGSFPISGLWGKTTPVRMRASWRMPRLQWCTA